MTCARSTRGARSVARIPTGAITLDRNRELEARVAFLEGLLGKVLVEAGSGPACSRLSAKTELRKHHFTPAEWSELERLAE